VYRVEEIINTTKKVVRDSGSAKTLMGFTSELHAAISLKNALIAILLGG